MKYDDAIKTEYGGQLYRSRLKARWAVFFDSLGIKHVYVPEGYDLKPALPPPGEHSRSIQEIDTTDDNYYTQPDYRLPDFWLPWPDFWLPWHEKFINIESATYDDGQIQRPTNTMKLYCLREITGYATVIICGTPGRIEEIDWDNLPYMGFVPGDCDFFWCECPECGSIDIQYEGRSIINKHFKGCKAKEPVGVKNRDYDSPRLQRAYSVAEIAFIK